jgi:glutathione synthase/RimK-type ligase-like ATP-grasp enzyme
MKIAIATCATLPVLREDEQLLSEELENLGIETKPLVWSRDDHRGFDGILIRTTWDYWRQHREFLAWFEKTRDLRMFNSRETMTWNLDKSYLFELEEKGVRIVPSMKIAPGSPVESVARELRARGWSDVVLKPTISAGADLTFRLKAGAPEWEARLAEVHGRGDALLQPFQGSVESSGEVSLLFFNEAGPAYSHAILKTPRAGDYRVQAEHGGAVKPFEPAKKLIEFGRHALSCVSTDWTYARVDILGWESEPMLGELEMIEPDLFLRYKPESPQRLARLLAKVIRT